MTTLDREILAERTMVVERHLQRVRKRLPETASDFLPGSDASDSVILHLWQAIQIIIDTSTSACVHLRLGSPTTYADAFVKLAAAGFLDKELSIRLCHATRFRNQIVNAIKDLDMQKIYIIAQNGPSDLKAFLAAIAKVLKCLSKRQF